MIILVIVLPFVFIGIVASMIMNKVSDLVSELSDKAGELAKEL